MLISAYARQSSVHENYIMHTATVLEPLRKRVHFVCFGSMHVLLIASTVVF